MCLWANICILFVRQGAFVVFAAALLLTICHNVLLDSATHVAVSSVSDIVRRQRRREGGLWTHCVCLDVLVLSDSLTENWWEPVRFLSGDHVIFRTCLRSLEYAKNNKLEPPTTHDAFFFFFLPMRRKFKVCCCTHLLKPFLSHWTALLEILVFQCLYCSRMPFWEFWAMWCCVFIYVI